MTTGPVISTFDEQSGVATLTFNRPEVLNAADVPMAEAFLEEVWGLSDKPGLRCVLLTGSGRAFMAGGDVASMSGSPEQAARVVDRLLDALNPAILRLRSLDAPVIAGVRGAVAGAGLSLALMADLIVAHENARFMIGYNGIGAVPDCGGSWFLPRRIGISRAAEMMLLSRTLTATEARVWGLIAEVAPEETYETVLSTTINKVANGPTRAFGEFRRQVDNAWGPPLAAHLEAERQAFLRMTQTEDFAQGVAAFLAKRPAVFSGN